MLEGHRATTATATTAPARPPAHAIARLTRLVIRRRWACLLPFNGLGPVVATPQKAVQPFATSGLDLLVLGRLVARKPSAAAATPPLAPAGGA